MGVKGDFSGLSMLRQKVAGLATSEHRRGVSRVLAEEARHQVQESFARSVDPYDKPWKPLASRQGVPLRDTGRLLNSFTVQSSEHSFSVATDTMYAATHQYGATIKPTRSPRLVFRVGGRRPRGHGRGRTGGWVSAKQVTIPKRQMVPEGDVGPRWAAGLEHAADVAISKHMGGL